MFRGERYVTLGGMWSKVESRGTYKGPSRWALVVLQAQASSPTSHLRKTDMFAFASLAAFAAAALPQVFAHGGVLSYKIGGQIFQGWAVRAAPLRLPSSLARQLFGLFCSTHPSPLSSFLLGSRVCPYIGSLILVLSTAIQLARRPDYHPAPVVFIVGNPF